MAITFRVGRYIDPSGFGLAVVDVPSIDPERNISLIDQSYKWEENVANVDSAVIESYVDQGGHMPRMTVTNFVVTNITTTATGDIDKAPLYYKHLCRFYHYSYGENPTKQVYITDQDENILKSINYIVRAERMANRVFKIEVLTDFQNNEYMSYKVKYNRCLMDGTEIYPSWTETLNAQPLFTEGNPLINVDEYQLYGPDEDSLWTVIVPPVPVLSELANSIGISFENAPTTIKQDVTNTKEYSIGVTVTYTIKASGTSTFTIKRNYQRNGVPANDYLQSATADSWGASPVNFNIGTEITGIPGVYLVVNSDNYLRTNDEAYFTATRAYYYLMPTAYSAIYLKKPQYVTPDDDWYIRVKNGRFRRRMDSNGNVVPSGQGTLWEYAIPEYDYQMWDLNYGPPYKESLNERVELIEQQTVQLQRTPLFIDPSSVLNNPSYPGFPPSGFIKIYVNEELVPEDEILDWDVYNGWVRVAQILDNRDDLVATYKYEENFYEYSGFVGSGGIFPDVPPFTFYELDLNPTPSHSYDVYASGLVAHVFLRPYLDVDNRTVVTSEALYHNFSGVASGVYDFKLGSLALGPNCTTDDVTLIDTRTRGGGLNKLGREEVDKVIDVQPEVEFYWDVGYFDGQAFPSNGVIVINVPKRVLADHGGVFNEDEVRQKVMKHMALGEYPIINYV
jgi:hypothetical protein